MWGDSRFRRDVNISRDLGLTSGFESPDLDRPGRLSVSRDYAGQMGKARVVEKRRINIPERVSFGPGRRQNSKTPVPRTNVLYISHTCTCGMGKL